MTTSTEKSFFDLHITGLGYLNRIREVKPKKGEAFWACDIAALNGNYAIQAGFDPTKDTLATEKADGLAAKTYQNILVVKEGNENTAKTKELKKALKSDEVRDYINKNYKGAVVPVF